MPSLSLDADIVEKTIWTETCAKNQNYGTSDPSNINILIAIGCVCYAPFQPKSLFCLVNNTK